jgi:hypothetical protein
MSQLTGVLKEIAEVAGEAAAIALAAQVGGNRVYFPARLKPKHWLVECVGLRAAEKIVAHFRDRGTGQYIDIPIADAGAYPQLRRAIAKRVHELDKSGKSAREITSIVRVTSRTVHRHRRAHRGQKNPKQGALF